MCGRLNISDHPGVAALMATIGLDYDHDVNPSYNVAPGSSIVAVVSMPVHTKLLSWGLTPAWAQSPIINAMAETVYQKKTFSPLMEKGRALIPVNGFYEWQRTSSPSTPYYFCRANGEALWLAALVKQDKVEGQQICIITQAANMMMEPIHHRMPMVVTNPERARCWLESEDRQEIEQMLAGRIDDDVLEARQVSRYVSSATHDGPKCVEETTD